MGVKIILPNLIAKETAYRITTNKSALFTGFIRSPYDNEFVGRNGSSVRIRVLGSLDAYFFEDGDEIVVQDWEDSSIELKVDKQIDVSVGLSQREATFDIEDFTKAVADESARAISKKLEDFNLRQAVKSLKNFLTLGDLDTSDKLIDINTFFDENEVDLENRIALVSTEQKSIILKKCKDVVETYKRGDNEAIKNAEVGFIYGSDYRYSTVLNKIANAVVKGTYTSGATLAVKASKGVDTIYLTGGTAGETISELTVLKAGSAYFVASENVTIAAGGTAEIKVTSFRQEIAVGTEVEYAGVVNALVFDKNSFVFVTVAPAKTVGEDVTYMSEPKFGLGLSINWGYDIKTKKGIVSFSMFAGFLNVNSDLNAGVIAAA